MNQAKSARPEMNKVIKIIRRKTPSFDLANWFDIVQSINADRPGPTKNSTIGRSIECSGCNNTIPTFGLCLIERVISSSDDILWRVVAVAG